MPSIASALPPKEDQPTKLPTAREVQDELLRVDILKMLDECTETQIAFLHRVHDNAPWKGLANCPSAKLFETYDLVCRTVVSNRSKAEGARS